MILLCTFSFYVTLYGFFLYFDISLIFFFFKKMIRIRLAAFLPPFGDEIENLHERVLKIYKSLTGITKLQALINYNLLCWSVQPNSCKLFKAKVKLMWFIYIYILYIYILFDFVVFNFDLSLFCSGA